MNVKPFGCEYYYGVGHEKHEEPQKTAHGNSLSAFRAFLCFSWPILPYEVAAMLIKLSSQGESTSTFIPSCFLSCETCAGVNCPVAMCNLLTLGIPLLINPLKVIFVSRISRSVIAI